VLKNAGATRASLLLERRKRFLTLILEPAWEPSAPELPKGRQ
jgi:hypothetical protein